MVDPDSIISLPNRLLQFVYGEIWDNMILQGDVLATPDGEVFQSFSSSSQNLSSQGYTRHRGMVKNEGLETDAEWDYDRKQQLIQGMRLGASSKRFPRCIAGGGCLPAFAAAGR